MNDIRKKTLLFITYVISVIYVIWRIFFTLPIGEGIFDMLCGILLLLSEVVGFVEAANQYTGMFHSYEPEKPDMPEDMYPEVDVFIATYNEEENILKKTINGCKSMDYPSKDKVHIYICDDTNRLEIKKLADKMQIGYITRSTNVDAKAVNYNNALKNTKSPLIATFDADMIPMHDFLMSLIPYFFLPDMWKDRNGNWRNSILKDEKLKIGFIQSPQNFYNLDLFQYNLYSENKVPNEQDFFFKQVQLLRNRNNSVIYAGSNTILSSEALHKVGGFYTKVITEDLATGLLIQSKGYRCFAIGSVYASGLAPTDIRSLIKQRERWARGCLQTFRKMRIFRLKGLTISQKFSYLLCAAYWYTPIRRVVFIMSPILFSIFNVIIIKATILQVLIFWMPQILLYNKTISTLSGNIRTSRLSNIYDTIIFPSLGFIVILESLGIEQKKFNVTKKVREDIEWTYKLKVVLPHIALVILSVISILICIYKTLIFETGVYSIILLWLFINLYNLVMAVLFVAGRKTFRNSERIKLNLLNDAVYHKSYIFS